MHLKNLDDDAIRSIATATKNIRCLGPISIVMFSRVCRHFHFLLLTLTKDAKERWVQGFCVSYMWKVPFRDESSINRIYSPVFMSEHGHHWRLLFCRGENFGPSLYVDVANAVFLPEGWTRKTTFKIQFHNVDERKTLACPLTDIIFCKNNRDWGYRVFVPFYEHDLFCDDFVDANGAVTISCEIHVEPILPSSITSTKTTAKPCTRTETKCKKQTLTDFVRYEGAKCLSCTLCNSKVVFYNDATLICDLFHCLDTEQGICAASRVVQPDVNYSNDCAINTIDHLSLCRTTPKWEASWHI